MRFREYLFAIVKKAIFAPWRLAEIVATVISILGGLLTWLFPKTVQYINLANWVIPLVLLTIPTIYRLFLAPYWLIKEEKAVSAKYLQRLVSIEQAGPNVSVSEIKQAPLYRDSPVTKCKMPTYESLQVWFKNHPEESSENSVARQVSAEIDFTSTNGSNFSLHVYGRWTVNNPPNFVASGQQTSIVDIPPGSLPVKLNIALKHINDSSAYAYSQEGLTRSLDGRDVTSEIPPGNYLVTVLLSGIGINRKYLFELTNPGAGETLSLKAV